MLLSLMLDSGYLCFSSEFYQIPSGIVGVFIKNHQYIFQILNLDIPNSSSLPNKSTGLSEYTDLISKLSIA